MNPPPDPSPRRSRASVRLDARLDAETRATLEELAAHFHRSRAAVVCQVLRWGLGHEQSGKVDRGEAQGPVQHLFVTLDIELHRQMGEAARASRYPAAAWLRHLLRQITVADFPASWQAAAGTSAGRRSHDSRVYGARFMLRLDAASETTLQRLAERFDVPRAEIIRQLLAQATPDTFPASWHRRVAERHVE